MSRVSIEFYLNTQIILTFWLVLVYDQLEDRRPNGAIITIFQSGLNSFNMQGNFFGW